MTQISNRIRGVLGIIVAVWGITLAAVPAGAFTLEPANVVGAGKYVLLGGAISTIASDTTTQSLTYGALLKVGLTDKTDISVGYGTNNLSNLPAGTTSTGSTMYGYSMKRVWLEEAPISVATSLSYVGTSTGLNVGGAPVQQFVGESGISLIFSKFFQTRIPILPYIGTTYKSINTTTTSPLGTADANEVGFEFSLGTYMFFTDHLSFFYEYCTLRRTQHNGGPAATTTQHSGGFAWVL